MPVVDAPGRLRTGPSLCFSCPSSAALWASRPGGHLLRSPSCGAVFAGSAGAGAGLLFWLRSSASCSQQASSGLERLDGGVGGWAGTEARDDWGTADGAGGGAAGVEGDTSASAGEAWPSGGRRR